jgi:hypothetical protein
MIDPYPEVGFMADPKSYKTGLREDTLKSSIEARG